MAQVLIRWTLADGEEREERWPSVERFRTWAKAEGLRATFTAFEDDDGEWVIMDQGRV